MKEERKNSCIRKISVLILALMMIVSLSSVIYAANTGNTYSPKFSSGTLTFTAEHGTLTSNSEEVIKGGASTPVEFTAAEGFEFEGIYCNGTKLGASGTDSCGNSYTVSGKVLTITNVQEDATYEFKGVPVKKIDLAFTTEHGVLTTYSQNIEQGKSAQVVECTPAKGYIFEGIYCNGVKLGASGTDAYGNTYTVSGATLTITKVEATASYEFKSIQAPKETQTIEPIDNNGENNHPSVDNDTPETGDQADIVLWLIVALMSMGISVLMIAFKKKQSKQ